MTILLLADHDNNSLKDATARAVTAAGQLGGDLGRISCLHGDARNPLLARGALEAREGRPERVDEAVGFRLEATIGVRREAEEEQEEIRSEGSLEATRGGET